MVFVVEVDEQSLKESASLIVNALLKDALAKGLADVRSERSFIDPAVLNEIFVLGGCDFWPASADAASFEDFELVADWLTDFVK